MKGLPNLHLSIIFNNKTDNYGKIMGTTKADYIAKYGEDAWKEELARRNLRRKRGPMKPYGKKMNVFHVWYNGRIDNPRKVYYFQHNSYSLLKVGIINPKNPRGEYLNGLLCIDYLIKAKQPLNEYHTQKEISHWLLQRGIKDKIVIVDKNTQGSHSGLYNSYIIQAHIKMDELPSLDFMSDIDSFFQEIENRELF